ncbi:MAG: hypothetical protein Q7T61_16040 [Caulobacter sp.]|nr:hypothetical protein [Caulobacter sp.]
MSEGRRTVAGAYMMIAAHEQLCAERYRGINEKLSWVLRSLVGMLLALLGWALVQLYALEPLRRQGASAEPGRLRPTVSVAGRPWPYPKNLSNGASDE